MRAQWYYNLFQDPVDGDSTETTTSTEDTTTTEDPDRPDTDTVPKKTAE